MAKAAKFVRVLAPVALVCAPLVVALAPAGATTSVSTEAQLRTAFGNASETSVSITADITLSNCGVGAVTRTSANAITVEGNGHTVHQTCNANTFQQTSSGNVTFNDLVIAMHGGQDGIDAGSGSKVTLNNVSIPNVNDGDGVDASGNVVMNNSSMTGIGDGDGISIGGNVTMTGSTISGVTTGDGLSNGGTDTLTDSEISGQIGSQDCDAISTGGAFTLTRSSACRLLRRREQRRRGDTREFDDRRRDDRRHQHRRRRDTHVLVDDRQPRGHQRPFPRVDRVGDHRWERWQLLDQRAHVARLQLR